MKIYILTFCQEQYYTFIYLHTLADPLICGSIHLSLFLFEQLSFAAYLIRSAYHQLPTSFLETYIHKKKNNVG